MLPAKLREHLLLGLVTAAAAVAGWWSNEFRSGGSRASSGAPPSESIARNQSSADLRSSPTPAKAAAGHFSDARFSKTAEFDRIFAASKGRIDRQLIAQLYAALQGLDSKEYELALVDVLRRRQSSYKSYEIAGLIASAWAEQDLEAARDWLMRTPHIPGIFMCFEEAILQPWSHKDNAGMFRWLLEHAADIPPSRKDAFGATLVRLAAEGDAEAGLQLLARIDPGRRSNIFVLWAARDPAAAAARALAETNDGDRNAAVKSLVYGWAKTEKGTAEALAWAEKLSDPALANGAIVRIGQTVGERDPRAGAEILVNLPKSNEVRQGIAYLASGWAARDWAESVRWVLQLEDEDLSKWLLTNVGKNVAREKFLGVLETLPEEARQTALHRWETALPPSGKNPPAKTAP